MRIFVVIILSLVFTFNICGNVYSSNITEGRSSAIDTICMSVLGRISDSVLIINDTIDLHEKECHIPAGITLKIKGGYIKNGTLVGNMTRLKSCNPCFNMVRIKGTWNVPLIYSTLFDDLSYDNSLKDVVALSHPSIKNKIIIKEGFYQVSALRNTDACVTLNSNTEFVLDGVIQMRPNSYRCYNIIQATGENIIIKGNGSVIGDKHTHIGKDGEWGMGIMLLDAHNVTVECLTVKDCWGDCIYVGDNSTKVSIKKCTLIHGRRQGISVTSGDDIIIKDCKISYVFGTKPEYAIDVEPNKNEFVDNVIIDNLDVFNCIGGVKAACAAKNARIGSVIVRNCNITAKEQYALRFINCESAIAKNNNLKRDNNNNVMICHNVRHLKVERNTLSYSYYFGDGLKSVVKRIIRNDISDVISITDCKNRVVRGNITHGM